MLTRFGANLCQFAPYQNGRPFINLLRLNNYSGTSFGAIGNGATQIVGVISPFNDAWDTTFTYCKPGKYICTWSGPLTLSLENYWNSGAGVTGASLVSANRYEITVTDGFLGRIALRIQNATGSSQTLPSDMAVYHEEDEARFLQGKTFRREYLNNMNWCKIIRPMDWIGALTIGQDLGGDPGGSAAEIATAAGIPLTYADFPQNTYGWGGGGVPLTAVAELAIELGADIHLVMPVRASRECMRDMLQVVRDSGWTGKLIAEYGNELWNTDAPYLWSQEWCANVVADGLDVDGDDVRQTVYDSSGAVAGWTDTHASVPLRAATGMAIGAQRLWYEAEQIFGRARVIRAMGAWMSFYQTLGGALYVQCPLYGNARLKALADEYHIAGYMQINATDAMPDVSLKALCTQKAYLLDDADWVESMTEGNAGFGTTVDAHRAFLNSAARDIVISSYEAGLEAYDLRTGFVAQGHASTVNTAANALDFAASVAASFETGDLVATAFYASPSGSVPGVKTPYYCRMVSSTRMKLYTTLAHAQADSNAVTINWTNGDSIAMENYSRIRAINDKLVSIFDGAAGRQVWEDYFNKSFRGRRNRFMAFGASAQQYAPDSGYFSILQYESTEQTPRLAWLREMSAIAEARPAAGVRRNDDAEIQQLLGAAFEAL